MLSRFSFAQRVALVVGLGSVFLLLVFLLSHGMWYDGLDTEQRTAFWNEFFVAYGTLALAGVTWASVAETQEVISGEDRRHQQGYAPLLTLSEPQLNGGRFRCVVYNKGLGLALKVLVILDGEFSTTRLVNTPPTMALAPMPNIPVPESSKTHHIGVVARDGTAELSFPQQQSDYGTVSLKRVRIEYSDMFGNDYSTEYRAFSVNINEFVWTPPERLRFRSRSPVDASR